MLQETKCLAASLRFDKIGCVIPRLQTLLIRLRVRWLRRASFANSYKCLYIMTGNIVPLTKHKALCLCHRTDDLLFAYKTHPTFLQPATVKQSAIHQCLSPSLMIFLSSLYFYGIVFCSLMYFPFFVFYIKP